MIMQLLKINGKFAGYTFIAEDELEKAMLEVAQSLNFLANNKQERVHYDGVMLDENAKVSRIVFMQHQYAAIPDTGPQKREIYNAMMRKGIGI